MARLPPPPFAGLRSRLLLLVLLAVLPALGLTLATNLAQRRQAVAQAQGEALRLARVVAGDEERLLEGARQLLVLLARLPAVREAADGDPAPCVALLADLLAQSPRYANLAVARADGEVVCSAVPAPPGAAVSAADRAYFRRALEAGDFAVGEYQIGRITGRASVNFGYPVLDAAGGVRAVAIAALDLAWLNELAAEAQLPPGAGLTVIDRAGAILVRYPDPEPWLGQPMAEAVLAAVRAAPTPGEGTAAGPGVDGVPRLYAFAPLGGGPRRRGPAGPGAPAPAAAPADAYVIVGLPAAAAFAAADRALTAGLRWLALVGALALATAAVGGDVFILRRLRALIRATRRLGAGDLSARTGLPHGPGELGQLAQAIDELAASLQRAHQRLVDDLLDLAGLEAGEIPLRRAAVDVVPLVRRVAATLRPALEAKGQRLALEFPRAPLVAWADAERVAQVLANLLSNAHRHTPAGGRIAVAARAADGLVRLDVRDTGPGIPPDVQARLFARPARARGGPGPPPERPAGAAGAAGGGGAAGLGLPISRALVELHGGRLTVASVPGRGATFTVTLPAAPPAGGGAPPAAPPGERRPAGEGPQPGGAGAVETPAPSAAPPGAAGPPGPPGRPGRPAGARR
jgi:signal transduction histidine kinase